MPACHPLTDTQLPLIWLLSDARNDARLEKALAGLPPQSGFVFRHYHLDEGQRRARFTALRRIAHEAGHVAILSGTADKAQEWQADGVYGATEKLGPENGLLRLATAHDLAELRQAEAVKANGVFLSPVFATHSHPGGKTLGARGFHSLAKQTHLPVIALGGMNAARAKELDWPRWGAIDGLSQD